MKKLIAYILLLQLVACNERLGVYEREVVCLVDETDSGNYKAGFSELKPLIVLSNNDNGMLFSVAVIGDVDFGHSIKLALVPRHTDEETEEDRYARKKLFLQKAETSYDSILHLASSKDYSIIYRVVAAELNRLTSSSAQEKILVVSSDLLENSDLLNVYSRKDLELLYSNEREVAERFSKQVPLQSLSGIKVYFLFKPGDFAQNKSYRAMLNVYQTLIEGAGGKVLTGL